MLDPAYISSAIERLRSLDRKLTLFGAMGHQYRFNERASEKQLSDFERTHKIELPEEYRLFLRALGNGGPGPYYGVFPLGVHDDNHDFCTWDKGSLVGSLSQPFAYTDAWNLPDEFWALRPNPEGMSEAEEDVAWSAWDAKLEAEYWDPSIVNGALPICNLGCALRHWLIVNGPCYGQVWADNRVDDAGLAPLLNDQQRRLTFGDWYMLWLSDAERKFGAG